MPEFSRTEFNEFILAHDIIGFCEEPIRLKSGRTTHWYVNWRDIAGDVMLLDRTADFILRYCRDHALAPDVFVGVAEGATPLGIVTQYKYAHATGSPTLIMGRGKPKEHGKPEDRYFIGNPHGKKVIVLEDVTTTGGSLVGMIEKLSQAGAEIIGAIGLTNRMEKGDDGRSVEELVHHYGVRYFALSNALELLPLACQKYQLGGHIKSSIETEFSQYGVRPLQL